MRLPLWCRRDMLCCQNEGILTPFQGAQLEILCTHPVTFAITCLATSGPTNISAASVYNNNFGYPPLACMHWELPPALCTAVVFLEGLLWTQLAALTPLEGLLHFWSEDGITLATLLSISSHSAALAEQDWSTGGTLASDLCTS